MLQGTGSDVGKSVLTAALCRIAKQKGLRVAPFKPQNMSNNAMACAGGGEIGRAQALQARAAGLAPHVDMNPVLLKPQTDRTAQVVVHGKALSAMEAAEYMRSRDQLMSAVLESFERLVAANDLVIVEGAGSPAEINLRARDIANMGFARRANVPVCLIGDIDKGGVIASLVGTQAVLAPDDADMIKGFLINKFRGDPALFEDGVQAIEKATDWPCFGVIPWLKAPSTLPAEDAVSVSGGASETSGELKVVAPMLSRMANFDDADPLRLDPAIDFHWTPPGKPLPRDADLVILFGTKSTIGDLQFLREQGWDHDILAHARAGGRVLGICGGYQMLGQRINDPNGYDGPPASVPGLGLLNVSTVMTRAKQVQPVTGQCARTRLPISGYEIHVGHTTGRDTDHPFSIIRNTPEGARSADGRIQGTYLHGAFSEDEFRYSWLSQFDADLGIGISFDAQIETALDDLAANVAKAADIDALLQLARTPDVQSGSG
ncbi:MAG: cobyric acid synthase [Henriciella sp.]|nr:cobyric acid synthase [Henriciella sp.]